MKNTVKRAWREWLRPFVLAFLIVGPLKSAVADWNWVPTGSMKPSILEGELVAVNKLAYDLKVPFTTEHLATWGNPARGDVIVFYSPEDGTRLVKRVVGLPGDTVELRNETVYLNGVAQQYSLKDADPFRHDVFEDNEPVVAVEHLGKCDHYVMALPNRSALRTFGPSVVTPDHYFVMGDSRDNSKDSRFIGSIPRGKILGRVPGVVLSFDPSRYYLPRWRRIFERMTVNDT
ncbi:MAG: signal peptidase I [Chthoniobacterales bacterium]|nr:signal peptidase I [Chthoniobacterales bacterium]